MRLRAVLTALVLLAGAGWHLGRPAPEHVRTNTAVVCRATLFAWFELSAYDRRSRAWRFVHDDGAATLQRDLAGRWVTLDTSGGGEGILRAPWPTETVEAATVRVRTVHAGVASAPKLVEPCR